MRILLLSSGYDNQTILLKVFSVHRIPELKTKYLDVYGITSPRNLTKLLLTEVIEAKADSLEKVAHSITVVLKEVMSDLGLDENSTFNEINNPLTLGQYAVKVESAVIAFNLGLYTGVLTDDITDQQKDLLDQTALIAYNLWMFFQNLDFPKFEVKRDFTTFLRYRKGANSLMSCQVLYTFPDMLSPKVLGRLLYAALDTRLSSIPLLFFIGRCDPLWLSATLNYIRVYAPYIRVYAPHTREDKTIDTLIQQLSKLSSKRLEKLVGLSLSYELYSAWFSCMSLLVAVGKLSNHVLRDRLLDLSALWSRDPEKIEDFLNAMFSNGSPDIEECLLARNFSHWVFLLTDSLMKKESGLPTPQTKLLADVVDSYIRINKQALLEAIMLNSEGLGQQAYKVFLLGLMCRFNIKNATKIVHGNIDTWVRTKLCGLLDISDFRDAFVERVVARHLYRYRGASQKSYNQAAKTILGISGMDDAVRSYLANPRKGSYFVSSLANLLSEYLQKLEPSHHEA